MSNNYTQRKVVEPKNVPKEILKQVINDYLKEFNKTVKTTNANKEFPKVFKVLYKATYIVLQTYPDWKSYSDLTRIQQKNILYKFLHFFSWTWRASITNPPKAIQLKSKTSKTGLFSKYEHLITEYEYQDTKSIQNEFQFVLTLYLDAIIHIVSQEDQQTIINHLMQELPESTELFECYQKGKNYAPPIPSSLYYIDYIAQLRNVIISLKTDILDNSLAMKQVAIAFTTLKEFSNLTNLNPSNYIPKFYRQINESEKIKKPIDFKIDLNIYKRSIESPDAFKSNDSILTIKTSNGLWWNRYTRERSDSTQSIKKELESLLAALCSNKYITKNNILDINCNLEKDRLVSTYSIKKLLYLSTLYSCSNDKEKTLLVSDFSKLYELLNRLTEKDRQQIYDDDIDIDMIQLKSAVNLLEVLTPTHCHYMCEQFNSFAPNSIEATIYSLISQLLNNDTIDSLAASQLDSIYDDCIKLGAYKSFIKLGLFIYHHLPMNDQTLLFLKYCLEKTYDALIQLFTPLSFEVPEEENLSDWYSWPTYKGYGDSPKAKVSIPNKIVTSMESIKEVEEHVIYQLHDRLLQQIQQALSGIKETLNGTQKVKKEKKSSCQRAINSIIILYPYVNILKQKILLQAFNELNTIKELLDNSLTGTLDKATLSNVPTTTLSFLPEALEKISDTDKDTVTGPFSFLIKK